MKNLLFTIALIASALLSKAQPVPEVAGGCSDLFFSELTFGKNPNGNIWDLNYAIEIFNPTQSVINLNNYKLKLTNGVGNSIFLNLSGTVLPWDVHVVANSSSDQNLQSMADELFAGLDFETTVILELEHNGTTIDKIGQTGTPTAGSIDVIQLIADPYGYLNTFHLDLNDYQNIDIRRGATVDKGDPNFTSATSIIGKWAYYFNVDRTDIGKHICVCNKQVLTNGVPEALAVIISYPNTLTEIDCIGSTNLLLTADFDGGPTNMTYTHTHIGGTATFTGNNDLRFWNCPNSTVCNSTSVDFTMSPMLGADIASNYANYAGYRDAIFELTGVTSTNTSYVPYINPAMKTTVVKLKGCNPEATSDLNINNSFSMYPNPTNNWIEILTNQDCTLKLYDISGKQILIQSIYNGKNNINISSFSKGLYHVQLIDNKSFAHSSKILTIN